MAHQLPAHLRKFTVTGGSGFVGQRLCEMLVERGATKVVSFDMAPTPVGALKNPVIEYVRGDLCDYSTVLAVCTDVDCVFHIAALVGPYHDKEMFRRVNYIGSLNVLNACKENNIKKIVMSSSPSTRFPYPDPNINGYTEEKLFEINGGDYAPVFIQPYAETKAMGEKAIREACGTKDNDLLTIAVAPHQVYGPRDGLFLPSLLDAAGAGLLRILGSGENLISLCHVDNYCHGLICGAEALYQGSPALGKFYVITDVTPVKLWYILDQAVVGMGFTSLWTKFKIPSVVVMSMAYVAVFLGNIWSWLTGIPAHKVNHFVKLNPFAVKMMMINRYFDVSGAIRDLKYKPVVGFEDGWKQTIAWFQSNWLPKFKNRNGKL